jgi:hypothetical protein
VGQFLSPRTGHRAKAAELRKQRRGQIESALPGRSIAEYQREQFTLCERLRSLSRHTLAGPFVYRERRHEHWIARP